MRSDFYSGKLWFASRLSSDCTSWNLVSSLGLLNLQLLVLKEEKILLSYLCLCLDLDISWNFCFQKLSWISLSALTCKLGFTGQKFSIHGVLWKISKGRTLSLLVLVPCSRQINAHNSLQLPIWQSKSVLQSLFLQKTWDSVYERVWRLPRSWLQQLCSWQFWFGQCRWRWQYIWCFWRLQGLKLPNFNKHYIIMNSNF